jgi:ribonucleoside-diphosphate reductase alpha chain
MNKVINDIIENMEELSHNVDLSLHVPENGHMYENVIKDIIKRNMTHLDRKWLKVDDIIKNILNLLGEDTTLNQLYYLISDYCAGKISYHPDYNKLASRVCVERLHKFTDDNYENVLKKACANVDVHGNNAPLISDEFYQNAIKNMSKIKKALKYDRDYNIDYFGMRTLERSYLFKDQKDGGKIIERPQHLFMRTALFIHGNDLEKAFETYDLISERYFTHATPTLFNAGSNKPQGSSCFLLTMKDSLDGIFETISECAKISQSAGGIGIDISRIRANKSYIRGNNGLSNGIIPLCKVFNAVANYVNQGGKRMGSIAIYIQPWHSDIYDFCELRRNNKNEDSKARDLFLALWVPDIFMKRVEEDGKWSLMCPDECPNLTETYGDEFEELYIKYEKQGKYKKQVQARDLWFHILESQIETGTPYILFKDAINKKSNQMNVGIIRSSNLCVHEDTMILTKKGYVPIKSAVDTQVDVWNGSEWSNVTVKKTASNVDLIRVTLSNGSYLDCTPEHKFYIQINRNGKQLMIDACKLKKGDNLIKFDLPPAHDFEATEISDLTFKYPYTHGMFCGDGTTYDNYSQTMKYPKLYLYGDKKNLLEYVNYTHHSLNVANDRYDLILPKDIAPKFTVPLYYTTDVKLRWFEGYCDADGTIARNDTNESLQIASINHDFLVNVKYMLQTIGIDSKITLNSTARVTLLPDGKGGKKEYNCKEIWRLLINSYELYKLAELGFNPKRLKFDTRKPQRNVAKFVKVVNIEESYKNVDTYCFTEPKKHMGVFNGILTGQCSEITEVTTDNEIAVCNLASICLPRFLETHIEIINEVKKEKQVNPETNEETEVEIIVEIKKEKKVFNFDKLKKVAQVATYNLNKLIDNNYYPVGKAKTSNLRHRPVGLGIQGLACLYNQMGYSFGSEESNILNKKIFETIYFGALTESNNIAIMNGKPYETFEGSPFSKGKLQYHLWGKTEDDLLMGYDWKGLIESIKTHGTSNSLLTALMPTASTSQIMGNSECFEPYLSNIFTRSTLAGEFVVVNQHLVNDLLKLGLWSNDMRNKIIVYNGSIQNIPEIPDNIKEIYKTAFEIKQKHIVQQAIDRGIFIDQTQSMNLFVDKPDFKKITSCHFYSWKNGLKTGQYYLRSMPSVDAVKFGIDIDVINKIKGKTNDTPIVYRRNKKPKEDKDKKDDKKDDKKEVKKGRSYNECEMCSA